ncbi:MAG: molybdopterin oxidoreductase family protein [Rhodoferax sp.]|nr:molybdopterin oxidoreductase family protein [Rhodoferax sp.]
MTQTKLGVCNLCEAICGLKLTIEDGAVTNIRGNEDDPLSRGHICPKGVALADIYTDPDRLRRPIRRTGTGADAVWTEISWDEALDAVADGLAKAVNENDKNALGIYVGNPNAHSLGSMTHGFELIKTFKTRNKFSASSVDQIPHMYVGMLQFGHQLLLPVADIDRTNYFLVFGANPMASNGSLMTVPDFPNRVRELKARGGKMVVFDPRRTETAKVASEHHFIRPASDAVVLMAMVNTLLDEGLANPPAYVDNTDALGAAIADFTPEYAETVSGVPAAEIRRITREFAAADGSAAYGRIGLSTQGFGSICQWAINLLNILSGNLDRVGGVLFPEPAIDAAKNGLLGAGHFDIWRSRVRDMPEFGGELPVSCFREEIDTPGKGQIKAVLTLAGNPVLSTPDGRRLAESFAGLDFMASVDIYLNETTRHADVILPPPSQLQRSHYDLLLLQFAVRNVANYSPAPLPLDDGQPDEWEILAKLALLFQGADIDADPATADERAIGSLVHHAVADPHSRVHGRDADEILATLSADGRRGPERMLDLMLRIGPFGDAFGVAPGGATLQMLIDHPHGVDFGALEPRLPELLRTPSGRIELAHPALAADVPRLLEAMAGMAAQPLVLIGRRHLRSNNSWMHNIGVLVKGAPRCTLQVHPDDAVEFGLVDGGYATVTSRVGSVDAAVEVTEAIRPGVVSLPHGWGHSMEGTRLRVASERPGVNSNVLTDHEALDPLSGTSVLNGIPVTLVAR